MSSQITAGFYQALQSLLPQDALSAEPADLAEYGRDWTRVYEPSPGAVAFPRTTEEVAAILKLCSAHKVPVVPSGGRTGLAGGAVAKAGELVLSLSKMARMGQVDLLGNTLRVQAGCVTEAVHQACAVHGLTWPVDFASKGSSQVGGNIATNAGGVKVIRYGATRRWVLGLQVVTAEGEVLELGGALEKNNTGPDLAQLLIGSEGILAVVTEATLKLCPLPKRLDVLLFAVPDLAGVLALFAATRKAGFTLSAFEFFTDRCLRRVIAHRKVRSPFEQESGCYVLVEVEDAEPSRLEDFALELFERGLAQEGTVARGVAQQRELWTLREGISESLSATGLPNKNDVALPIAALEAFCAELDQVFALRYPGWEVCLFGHIGDGNIHINAMKPAQLSKEAFLRQTAGADEAIFELVRRHGGSISAEHGIGLLKKPYLHFTRGQAEVALLRKVKQALDPLGILNPGKVLPDA